MSKDRDDFRSLVSALVERLAEELNQLSDWFEDHDDLTPDDVNLEMWEALKKLLAAVGAEAEKQRRERLQ